MTTSTAEADSCYESQTNPTPIETFALGSIRVLGSLGMLVSLPLFFFLRLEHWQVLITWALLLTASIGLFACQRWAAVLACGIGWFGLATYTWEPLPGGRAFAISLEEAAFLVVHVGVALLLSLLPPLCARRLLNGLWTRPAANRPAAVIAVSASVVWLWFHLHALVEWESVGEARMRIVALGVTTGAALLALLWRRRSC
jgi:hypothetical protein